MMLFPHPLLRLASEFRLLFLINIEVNTLCGVVGIFLPFAIYVHNCSLAAFYSNINFKKIYPCVHIFGLENIDLNLNWWKTLTVNS